MDVWRAQPQVEPGVLLPCGSSPDGKHREFFANRLDVDELLRDGIVRVEGGRRVRYTVSLSSTPEFANGDVQIVARECVS